MVKVSQSRLTNDPKQGNTSMRSDTKRSRYLYLTIVAVLMICAFGRPAAAQTDPLADGELLTADTELGVANTELGTLNGSVNAVNGSINTMDGNITRMLGYPSAGGGATVNSAELNIILQPAAPTVIQANAQLRGTSGPNSKGGDMIAASQKEAIIEDEADIKDGAESSAEKRMDNTLNGLEGNVVDNLATEEAADKASSALEKTAGVFATEAEGISITNVLAVAQLKKTGNLERAVYNNTLATTLVEKHHLEADMVRVADVEATIKLLN